MFFHRKKTIVIPVDHLVYETATHILVEWKGRNIWLRRSRVKIDRREDGTLGICLSERYLRAKSREGNI